MNSRTFHGAAVCSAVLLCWSSAGAVAPPRDGGAVPDVLKRVGKHAADAYMPRHAWVQKAARIRAERREFVRRNGTAALASASFGRYSVTGTLSVPVLPGYFQAQSTPPVTATALQNNLFDSNPTGTIGQYYSEVSYGVFTVDGNVDAWTHLAHDNAYYAGSSNGVEPGAAFTGELIKEVLDARDGGIDFGQYDNDGPDGVPNSGDDDGYVDLLCVLHGSRGYECDPSGTTSGNILSHTWRYSAWPVSGALPYVTNDPAFNGGSIEVDDYTIAPALSCGSSAPNHTPIEIGVFCHEFGHGLGLPDLYDRDGSSNGIGYWGIMGAGEWNTPEKPAHPEAWTRVELGWVIPQDIGWATESLSIPNVEENAAVFRLPFADGRFRRMTECAIGGVYSLYCGLTAAEETARHYELPGPGGGYGPNWYETIEHRFHYDGTGAVTFQYDFKYDTEPNYDHGDVLIEVNGVETQLVSYSGGGNGTENIPLAAYLTPLVGTGGDYTLKFRVVTDYSFDDADGEAGSSCGALAVDNVSVTGGGENYTTDFEAHIDGWFQDPGENPMTEYWLVENRHRVGSDVNLKNEGLLIWHVDEETIHSPTLQNDGPNGAVRGVVLEEADGQFNLLQTPPGPPANLGDTGDTFPGTSGNVAFGSLTTPASTDNTGRATQIEVTNIGTPGSTTSATLRAGNRGPVATGAEPDSIDNDQVSVTVDVSGLRFTAGATLSFALSSGGAALAPGERRVDDSNDIVPVVVEWIDADLIRVVLNVYSKTAGQWDLVVTNPGGQSYTLADAITINRIVATQLRFAAINVVDSGVRLRYELVQRDPGETVRLYRSNDPDGGWRVIADDLRPQRADNYEFVDGGVESGHTYCYLLVSQTPGETPRELHRGSVTVPARDLVLEQNTPNPFNPTTSIRFFMPERAEVTLSIFDVRGGLVRRLARGTFSAGAHTLAWDGTDGLGRQVASGVYVYRLVSGSHVRTKKMMLVK